MNILQYNQDTMRYFENPPFTFDDDDGNVTSYLGFEKRRDPETRTTYNHPVIVKVAVHQTARVPVEIQQLLKPDPTIPTPEPVRPPLYEK